MSGPRCWTGFYIIVDSGRRVYPCVWLSPHLPIYRWWNHIPEISYSFSLIGTKAHYYLAGFGPLHSRISWDRSILAVVIEMQALFMASRTSSVTDSGWDSGIPEILTNTMASGHIAPNRQV